MTEGIEIQTIPDLTKRILNEWKRKEKEALTQQKEQKEKLKTAIQEEKELTEKLKMARMIAAKMQGEYSQLEIKTEIEKRQQIEKDTILESDVRAGKASFKEFVQKGKRESEISKLAFEETAGELSKGLKAIRNKNLEILELEESLLETQVRIRYLFLAPAQILGKVLKDLADFSDREMSLFIADINNSQTALRLKKEQILLTEGKSLGSGYTWNQISLEEAYKIQFSPILPQSLVPKLKGELKKHEESKNPITVNYFLRNQEIQVRSFMFGRKE